MTTAHAKRDAPEVATGATEAPGRLRLPSQRPHWERRLNAWLHGVDSVAIVLACAAALNLQPSSEHPHLGTLAGASLVGGITATWLVALGLSGAYESYTVTRGLDEYRRLLLGTWQFCALLAVSSFLLQRTLSRTLLVLVVSFGLVLLFLGRHGVTRGLAAQRARGNALHRVLVVGPPYRAADLINRVASSADGFTVVGVCTDGLASDEMSHDLPMLGSVDFGDITAAISRTGADTVALVGESDMPTGFIRELAWELEGTGVDLMVSPAITDIAGPRLHIRPVAELPMLYVESPCASGLTRVAKAVIDPICALLMLILVSPLLLVIATLIKIDSPGPVFFRQQRAGHKASYFHIWKFRTMRVDAETASQDLGLDPVLRDGRGKATGDPRVTGVGRFLRRTSLDELPQLINVVLGSMSLVGPRPVPADLESFENHELRRLLVRPGMTGLWQVSGRSDVNWDERVLLDLYYVENWSPLLDFIILLRTISVVVRGTGAY